MQKTFRPTGKHPKATAQYEQNRIPFLLGRSRSGPTHWSTRENASLGN